MSPWLRCWNLFWNAIGVVTFSFVDANQVITIDNMSWIIYSLVCCSRLEMDFIVNLCGKGWCATYNKEWFSFDDHCHGHIWGGLSANKLGVKLISMVCDGNNVFQGAKVSVTTWMKDNVAPFLIKVKCFAHQTYILVLVLSNFITTHFGFCDLHLWLNINCKGHIWLTIYEVLNPCCFPQLVTKDNDVII